MGTKLKIFYDPRDPQRWQRTPLINPNHELILAGVGVGFIIFAALLLVLGWFARRRSGRPYWL